MCVLTDFVMITAMLTEQRTEHLHREREREREREKCL